MTDRVVYLLTGPVRSGKTTALLQWAEKRKDVHGILTPLVNDKRIFMDANNKEQFAMEAAAGETNILEVGRFRFSKTGFDKAVQIIRDAIPKEGWLIIDEIGPLELRGEGFCEILKDVLTQRKEKILVVVREGLTDEVQQQFTFAGDPVSPGSLDSLQ